MQRLFVLFIKAELLMLGLRDRTLLGSGCSFSRLASTGCGLKPLPFESFCFLLFEGFSFLLLEGFSSHAGAENGMPLEGFSFGRLAFTEVLRHVGTHAAQGLRSLSLLDCCDGLARALALLLFRRRNLREGLLAKTLGLPRRWFEKCDMRWAMRCTNGRPVIVLVV